MFQRISLSLLLVGVLCVATGTRKPRPQGSVPSPHKVDGKESAVVMAAGGGVPQKPEVLVSSREALVVTERRYLRRDWCKTQPLRQTVSEDGCRSRTVVNRFCYGQCNSFYIPRHMGPSSGHKPNRGPGSSGASGGRRGHGNNNNNNNKLLQEPFQSCAFCRPHRVTQLTVLLDCPGLQPPVRHRKVQRVKQCRCISVDLNGHHGKS